MRATGIVSRVLPFLLGVAGLGIALGSGRATLENAAYVAGARLASALPVADAPRETSPVSAPAPPTMAPPRSEPESGATIRRPLARGKSTTLFVDAATVLRLANSGVRPWGAAVSGGGARNDGIRVHRVGALGIGVADGDVLTHVDGVPVTDTGAVIALVIAARVRRAPSMQGRLERDGAPYELIVQMPYPELAADAADPGPSR